MLIDLSLREGDPNKYRLIEDKRRIMNAYAKKARDNEREKIEVTLPDT
jgi:hypothetical protein